jgi:protein-L-isoaspartate(D-aspartate) O-methyltransferase
LNSQAEGVDMDKLNQHKVKFQTILQSCFFIFVGVLVMVSGCAPQQVDVPMQPEILDEVDLEVDQTDEYIEDRMRLVSHAVRAQDLEDEDVIQALAAVPRHRFVPEEIRDRSYQDTALPIGYGQTISQPSLVALMTELLDLEPGDKVLEIGTGSGYQAAILAELGYVDVYSIEIVPELYERGTAVLKALGYDVKTMEADGYYGWEEFAPFDAIIVTAAPDHLPAPLADQLAEGGVMVIPIGPQGFTQTLWKFVKEEGELTAYNMGYVRFVPFLGEGVEGQ